MDKYNVTGMSCAACSARVEKAVSAVEGVTSCSVSLLTNSMGVEGCATPEAIVAAVVKAGYGASPMGAPAPGAATGASGGAAPAADALEDRETPVIRRRLIWSLILLVPLMYLATGVPMLELPSPPFLDNGVAMGVAQMFISALILAINQKFFLGGARGLLNGAPNMDTLVALGSGTSFVWSVCVLVSASRAMAAGDMEALHSLSHGYYFESAAMILTLITVGKMLEARSKGRTTDALRGLIRLAPRQATVVRAGVEQVIDASGVIIGDTFIVRPGESVPVDGVVLAGASAVDESALTGESVPADKEPGDTVCAATINTSGLLRCRATRVGADTTLSRVIELMSDAAATKAPIARVADRVAGVFVPVVIAIAIVTTVVWLACGQELAFALARGISVLVISCPCALGLATPVAIMVADGVGARHGILFKTAASLEQAGRAKIVALDKTGTITAGTPRVTGVLPASGVGEDELLLAAGSLEACSRHPLARAVAEYVTGLGMRLAPMQDAREIPGRGITARLGDTTIAAGNAAFMAGFAEIPGEITRLAGEQAELGRTPLYFARGTRVLGLVVVADTIKPDSAAAVADMKDLGVHVVMLTGDGERAARAVGAEAGVNEVVAGLMPDGKEQAVRALRERGSVVMVGDGINDAPALARADTGIAIGAGTDIAIDAADVVLMKSTLSDVPAAIRLSRATLRTIHQNLFWAFFYNAVGIPLAAGVFYPIFGWSLSPMFGAAAMSLSSFCVVSNALRLNFFNPHGGSRVPAPAADAVAPKENRTMKQIIGIKGMMCPHCEAHMKEALEKVDGVVCAITSHTEQQAVVELSKEVPEEEFRKAVAGAGYQYLGLKG